MTGTRQPVRHGTQSLERACALLRLIARRGAFGWSLMDLAAQAGMEASTAHRILGGLVRERLVQRGGSDRRYIPGPLLFELGYSVPVLPALVEQCQPVLAETASATGAVAFLMLRSGADFVCVARAGQSRGTRLAVNVGTRQPLIMSAGGIAILLALPEADAERLLRINMEELEAGAGRRMNLHRKLWTRCRAANASTNFGETVPGVHALAVAVRDSVGAPFAALSLVARAELIPASRAQKDLLLLQARAEAVAKLYQSLEGPKGAAQPQHAVAGASRRQPE